ncbi:MAG: histidine phosphatase family protein [Leucobacter sp.]
MTSAALHTRSIVVIRHGETDWNAELRIQGRTEVPLNDAGRAQARESAELLAAAGSWQRVITSPLGRAVETARIIADTLGLDAPTVDPSVLERDFGQAEGLTRSETHERWPDLEVPGAESLSDLAQRGAGALARMLQESPGAIVVAHGALMRAALRELTGTDVPRVLNGEAWAITHAQAERGAPSSPVVHRLGAPRIAVPK